MLGEVCACLGRLYLGHVSLQFLVGVNKTGFLEGKLRIHCNQLAESKPYSGGAEVAVVGHSLV